MNLRHPQHQVEFEYLGQDEILARALGGAFAVIEADDMLDLGEEKPAGGGNANDVAKDRQRGGDMRARQAE